MPRVHHLEQPGTGWMACHELTTLDMFTVVYECVAQTACLFSVFLLVFGCHWSSFAKVSLNQRTPSLSFFLTSLSKTGNFFCQLRNQKTA